MIMKTLYTLILATALTATFPVANASEHNNDSYQNNTGSYGMTYGGYWRADDGHGGWGKHDDMRKPHGVYNWNDCFYECKNDSNCKGIEFQSKKHGYNICEIHYDEFKHCEQKSSSNGSYNGDRSTCWVKDYPNTNPTDHHTDTSSDDDS